MAARLSNAALNISLCWEGLFGAPAFAPIGTMGDTLRGAPQRMDIAGRAEIIMVGIPDSSIALCTITEERWHVPQPAVKTAASTPSFLRISAIAGPVSLASALRSPPPPMKPI